MDYDYVPTVIFTHPPTCYIGYNQEDAEKKFGKENVKVVVNQWTTTDQNLEADKSKRCQSFLKIICLKHKNNQIVGL